MKEELEPQALMMLRRRVQIEFVIMESQTEPDEGSKNNSNS